MTQSGWGDNLSLSEPQMDREHGALLAEADEFSAAVDAGASRAELEMRLTRLIEGFQDHFDAEEILMRSRGFPWLEPHIDEHRKLIGQMRELRDALGSGSIKLCDALALFVRMWAEQHIKGPDASFAQFLHQGNAGSGAAMSCGQ
jgi:hemerythrin-like metal-binding protein